MNQSNGFKLASLLVVFVIGFYLGFTIFRREADNAIRESEDQITRTEREIQRYVTSSRDTTYAITEKRIIVTNVDSSLVRTVPGGETTIIRDQVVHVPVGDTLRQYSQVIEDSTITGTMEASVNGTLLDMRLNYSLRYPVVTITNKDSVVVSTTTTILNPMRRLLGGVEASGQMTNDGRLSTILSPYAGIRVNRHTALTYRYNLPVSGPESRRDPFHSLTLSLNL